MVSCPQSTILYRMDQLPEQDSEDSATSSPKPIHRQGFWLRFAIIVVLLGANITILWFSIESLALTKHQYEQSAETHAANIAEAVNQNLNASFEEVSLVMRSIAEEIHRQIVNRTLAWDSINQYARTMRSALPQINAVVINDADGRTVLIEGTSGPKVGVTDRDYFVLAKSGAGPSLIVSKLLFSRISQRYVTLVAYRVEGLENQFAGVVGGSILATYLQSQLAVFDLGSQGVITLRDTDGALIAQYGSPVPFGAESIGSRTVSPQFSAFVSSGDRLATVRTEGSAPWVARISTLRRMSPEPVVISVMVATQDYLKGWWNQVYSTVGLDCGFILLSLISGTLLIRAVSRVEREEVRFRAARDMAESSNLAKGRFLANMSHELRTPMNAVLGMHELLLETDLTARQQDYVVKSKSAATSLLALLNDILDFSKIEAGKLDLESSPFTLEAVLQDLAVIVSTNLGDKEIEFLYDIDPAVPPELVGDSLRVKQILVNLCGNAIKFTQVGEITVSVQVLSRSDARVSLKCSVTDTGVGIAADQLEQIFQAFSQADVSTSRRFGGTGLGLTISDRLVKMMGGSLTVESTPGQGSRFSFSLELSVGPLKAVPAFSPQQVLIVSHNPLARRVLGLMAQTAGWKFEVVSSLSDVPDQLAADWTAALIDLFAEGDNWQRCRRLRQSSESLVVVGLVNAHQKQSLQLSDTPPTFDGLLVKPFTTEMLARALADGRQATSSKRLDQPRQLSRRLDGVRLLLAEDNPFNQQVALELLQSEGASVSIAGNGAEAVQKFQETVVPFDAVLMDMRMPGVDGLEATRTIRRRASADDLPIIAMTANAMPSDRAACFEAGMNAHIAKPIDRNVLVETVRRLTRRPGDRPTFDRQAALERFGNNADSLDKVLRLWLENARAFPEEFKAASAEGHERLGRLFHSLKGSAATVGGTALAELAAAIETNLKTEPDSFLANGVESETSSLIDALSKEIELYLQTGKGNA